MAKRILVCAANSRDRDHLIHLAIADGGKLEPIKEGPPLRVLFPNLELELRFEIFDRREHAEKVRGLELAGVLNLEAVSNQECRSMILARLRP